MRTRFDAPLRVAGWLLAVTAASLGSASAANLDTQLQAHVRKATFEVVMKKPEKDTLVYERALPLEQLPYTERTDKYRSVGTAFAIGGNRFVSAAHVFSVGFDSYFGEPALRDASGNVHVLDKVLEYSSNQDFIVFSLKDEIESTALVVNRAPVIDETVFAVGNALGEGIVIRDGLFTSQTPEQEDGRWKWIRFSAAASPGNSGGPLLDKGGRVIGVVLRKSQNENLNYAVPMSVIEDAPANLARLGGRVAYWLPIMDTRQGGSAAAEFVLPLSYAQLAKKVNGYWDTFTRGLKNQLLENNADAIFPRGEGSTQLLHTVVTTDFLYMIGRKPDNTWDIFSPNDTQDANLPKNGYVSYGGMTGAMFVKVRKPDDVPAATFYADSKLYMDYVLKAVPLKRAVGPEQIRIVSLGKATEDSVFTDRYGRKWQARVWPVQHEDICIYSLSLPVPAGYVSMMRAGQPSSLSGTRLDLEEMASFAYVSYAGTLEQWRGFLAQKALLPATFDSIAIDYDYEKSFKYRSKRMALNFAEPLHKVGPQSLLTLDFSYFPEGSKITWDVAGVTVSEKKSGGATVSIDRRTKPAESLPDSFANEWTKMQQRQYPYDGTIVDNAGTAFVEGIYPQGAAPAKNAGVLYIVGYSAEGKKTQDEMSTLLKKWFDGLSVAE